MKDVKFNFLIYFTLFSPRTERRGPHCSSLGSNVNHPLFPLFHLLYIAPSNKSPWKKGHQPKLIWF